MAKGKTESFNYLLIGLKEYLDRDKKYPYPDLLRLGMNTLSLEMKKSIAFPKTMHGFLHLVSEPVSDWCPSNWIPEEFDGDFGLIDEGSLSEDANDYLGDLLERGVPEYGSAKIQQLAIDNATFMGLINKLREAYGEDNPEKAQKEYNLLRTFLIRNQFTLPENIRKTFRRSKYIDPQTVGELYEDCTGNQTYWICDRCGILTEKGTRLKGLKPSLCGNHSPDKSYVHQVEWQLGLRRLKDAIYQRVGFPGIPELNLYSALEELQKDNPDYFKELRLYPGVDCYDIQLRFSDDTIWAIDYKDVRDPYRLGKNLEALYGEGNLRYDESFYVISDRCINNYPDYTDIARQAAKKLPATTHIVSDKTFKKKVNSKIAKLQKGEN